MGPDASLRTVGSRNSRLALKTRRALLTTYSLRTCIPRVSSRTSIAFCARWPRCALGPDDSLNPLWTRWTHGARRPYWTISAYRPRLTSRADYTVQTCCPLWPCWSLDSLEALRTRWARYTRWPRSAHWTHFTLRTDWAWLPRVAGLACRTLYSLRTLSAFWTCGSFGACRTVGSDRSLWTGGTWISTARTYGTPWALRACCSVRTLRTCWSRISLWTGRTLLSSAGTHWTSLSLRTFRSSWTGETNVALGTFRADRTVGTSRACLSGVTLGSDRPIGAVRTV